MSNTIKKNKTLNEIIDNARELPIECQDWLLVLAKGMAFTKRCLLNQGNKEIKEDFQSSTENQKYQ